MDFRFFAQKFETINLFHSDYNFSLEGVNFLVPTPLVLQTTNGKSGTVVLLLTGLNILLV